MKTHPIDPRRCISMIPIPMQWSCITKLIRIENDWSEPMELIKISLSSDLTLKIKESELWSSSGHLSIPAGPPSFTSNDPKTPLGILWTEHCLSPSELEPDEPDKISRLAFLGPDTYFKYLLYLWQNVICKGLKFRFVALIIWGNEECVLIENLYRSMPSPKRMSRPTD